MFGITTEAFDGFEFLLPNIQNCHHNLHMYYNFAPTCILYFSVLYCYKSAVLAYQLSVFFSSVVLNA